VNFCDSSNPSRLSQIPSEWNEVDASSWWEFCRRTGFSVKDVALGLVEDCLERPLSPVDREVTIPGTQVVIKPFPAHILKVWEANARTLRGYQVGQNLTAFGRVANIPEFRGQIQELISEIEDPDVRSIDESAMKPWLESGSRSAVDPYIPLARLVLNDPSFYPVHPGFTRYLTLPRTIPYDSIDQVALQSDATVGFWDLRRLYDPRQSKFENRQFLENLRKKAYDWKRKKGNTMSYSKLSKCSPPLGMGIRAQNGGRVIYLAPKKVILHMMRGTQPMEKSMAATLPWYQSGDRENTRHQIWRVLNGATGTSLICGDDFMTKVGDVVVSGDTTSFDTSGNPFEKEVYFRLLQNSYPPSFLRLFIQCHRASYRVQVASSIGMVETYPGWGVISGYPDTHQMDSVIQGLRILNSSKRDVDSFMSDMNKFAWLRPEKQVLSTDVATLCQLIVSRNRPAAIHGLLSRVSWALCEFEGIRYFEPIRTNRLRYGAMKDLRVIQVLANAYGHEKFNDLMDIVSDIWKIRSSKSYLKALYADIMAKDHRPVGVYEREALSAVFTKFRVPRS
jgi:hypothetical protein